MIMNIWSDSLSCTSARTLTERNWLVVSLFINQSLELCIIILHKELTLYKIGRFLLKLKDSRSTFLRKPVTQIKPNCFSIIYIYDARTNVKWDWIDDPTQNYHVALCPQDKLWRIWIWYWYCTINKSNLVLAVSEMITDLAHGK